MGEQEQLEEQIGALYKMVVAQQKQITTLTEAITTLANSITELVDDLYADTVEDFIKKTSKEV